MLLSEAKDREIADIVLFLVVGREEEDVGILAREKHAWYALLLPAVTLPIDDDVVFPLKLKLVLVPVRPF